MSPVSDSRWRRSAEGAGLHPGSGRPVPARGLRGVELVGGVQPCRTADEGRSRWRCRGHEPPPLRGRSPSAPEATEQGGEARSGDAPDQERQPVVFGDVGGGLRSARSTLAWAGTQA